MVKFLSAGHTVCFTLGVYPMIVSNQLNIFISTKKYTHIPITTVLHCISFKKGSTKFTQKMFCSMPTL